jgi:hypothetical protein
MPEPEFYLIVLCTFVFFAVCSSIAAGLYIWGRCWNSMILKALAVLPFLAGLIVFLPMLLLLLGWIGYWIFGDTSTAMSEPGPPPSVVTNAAN